MGQKNNDKKANLNRRISQIRSNLFKDSNREFSAQIGEIEQNISQICLGKRNAGLEIVLKIVESIPEVNAKWLLTGEGTMLNTPTPAPTTATEQPNGQSDEVSMLKRTLHQLQDYNDLLKAENARLKEELERGRIFTSATTAEETILQ